MLRILIAGAGHIGTTIAHLLSSLPDYEICLADCDLTHVPRYLQQQKCIALETLDLTNTKALVHLIQRKKIQGLVSCLPFFLNQEMAHVAHETQIHYFDLTEDVRMATYVNQLAKNSERAFVTQCGLAPGFVNIIAHTLMQQFEVLDTIKLRCGGLPKISSNELQYALTWSIDGFINEYRRPCPAIENGQPTLLTPLSNLEHIQIDGLLYEAFNTSGGIGSLTETYKNKLQSINYKSIRYPGHRDRMRFLMQDLKLGDHPEQLKEILKNAIPTTTDDVVIVYITVYGKINKKLTQKDFVSKYYGTQLNDIHYSALQLTTAASASTVIHTVLQQPQKYHGHVRQEQFPLADILNGPFGHYLKESL